MTQYVAKKVDANGYIDFSSEENETWKILFERQIEVVQARACPEYLSGLKKLNMAHDHIPQCDEISRVLRAETGWSVVPVDAIIPLDKFFGLLANRQFPAASFIRTREELDFLQEPDIFHEYFGHCPLLTNQAYADFIQWYGEHAQKTSRTAQSFLGRLFWYTIEFGLIKTTDGLRIFGGGILSSFKESFFSLDSDVPARHSFDIDKMLMTPYDYDKIQKNYFVLSNIEQLFELKTDAIIAKVEALTQESQPNHNFVLC
jgi:phenylalanine-4-hydroxylase